jgi:transaldolase/glucose-6-phosphate isomerase
MDTPGPTSDGGIALALGPHEAAVREVLARLDDREIVARIWARDHTVWSPDPAEIADRLGWLDVATRMGGELAGIGAFRNEVVGAGYARVLLLGMGGSSLAPELYAKTFGGGEGIEVSILDSTDPAAVLDHAEAAAGKKTLFIVATKSGGTVETMSLFKFFYGRLVERVGAERAGDDFVAITDPGSALEEIAAARGFRETFLNDPNIGGRYSALSYFGLVPAALAGADVAVLLERAVRAGGACGPDVAAAGNPGAVLGAALATLAGHGRDKLTFVVSEGVAGFAEWAEQLIAESTGKAGRGILPVVHEPLAEPWAYGGDRAFVDLRVKGDGSGASELAALGEAGHPVVRIGIGDAYDLGGQFFLWEFAVAIAGHVMGIQPFDQPNVEAAKVLAREMVARHRSDGALPGLEPMLTDGDIDVYGDVDADDLAGAGAAFLSGKVPGDYVAIQAYVAPTSETRQALALLRDALRYATKLAVTVGYGPRFLHSTGQLHKGDAGNGLFIQVTADDARDAPIPDDPGSGDSSMTFGVLKAAQALGDRQALLDAGRRVIRFHLRGDVAAGLRRLASVIG